MRHHQERETDMGGVYALGLVLAIAIPIAFVLFADIPASPRATLTYLPPQPQREGAFPTACMQAPCLPQEIAVAGVGPPLRSSGLH